MENSFFFHNSRRNSSQIDYTVWEAGFVLRTKTLRWRYRLFPLRQHKCISRSNSNFPTQCPTWFDTFRLGGMVHSTGLWLYGLEIKNEKNKLGQYKNAPSYKNRSVSKLGEMTKLQNTIRKFVRRSTRNEVNTKYFQIKKI